jgi:hypothetical protein
VWVRTFISLNIFYLSLLKIHNCNICTCVANYHRSHDDVILFIFILQGLGTSVRDSVYLVVSQIKLMLGA